MNQAAGDEFALWEIARKDARMKAVLVGATGATGRA